MQVSGNCVRLLNALLILYPVVMIYLYLYKAPDFTYRRGVEDVWLLSAMDLYTTSRHMDNDTRQCPAIPPGASFSRQQVTFWNEAPDMQTIVESNPAVRDGGLFMPANCTARQKIAIIITFRDRWSHLLYLLSYLHPLLQQQQAHYRIYVSEQINNGAFNKGRLYNVGFKTAMEQERWDCIVLHDVDLIPETDDNLYRCAENPIHLSAGVDTLRYTLMYPELVGGVLAMTPEQYIAANGFSNSYWGWGGEDDDMEKRIHSAGMAVLHTSTQNGRYKMVPHQRRQPASAESRFKYMEKFSWETDGLSDLQSLNIKVSGVINSAMYTNISVDVDYKADS